MKKVLLSILTALLIGTAVIMSACGASEIPDDDGLIHVESVQIEGDKQRTMQVDESFTLSYVVLPQNAITKAVTISSSDDDVLSVSDTTVTALKVGTATVTVTSVDGGKTDSVTVTVEDVRVYENNCYTAEIIPERDARIDVTAEGVSSGDNVRITVKQNGTEVSSGVVVAGFRGAVSCSLEELGITSVGKYDFEFVFPGNTEATVTEVSLSDVEQRFYVTKEEGWSASASPETGNWDASDQHGTLKEDQIIVATGADTFGAVGLNVTLNNDRAPYIRFRVANLDRAKWAAKVLGTLQKDGQTIYVGADSRIVEEVTETEVTIDLRTTNVKIIATPFDLVGTGEMLCLGDLEGDYSLTLQLFVVGENGARDGSVTMQDVEIFRGNGEKTLAVSTQKYVALQSAEVSDIGLDVGKTQSIAPKLTGENGKAPSYDRITYRSDDETVAVVKDGVVYALGGGTATVTMLRYDGAELGSFTVSVRVPVESVTVSVGSNTLKPQQTLDLSELISVLPDDATSQSVSYTSDNEAVATVDAAGIVTAVGEGEAVITIASEDDASKTATVTIIVGNEIIAATEVTLDESTKALKPEEEFRLTATISPDNATNKTIVWTTSNENVACVSADGTVTAVGIGTATIMATAEGTSAKAECSVTVTRSYEYVAQDNFATGILLLQLSNAKDGDVVTLTLSGAKTFTAEATVGSHAALVKLSDVTDFEAGTYSLTASLSRNGETVNGFAFDSVTQYTTLYDASCEWGGEPAWGAPLTQNGSAYTGGAMGCLEQSGLSFGTDDVKLLVLATSFEPTADNGLYSIKFTVSGEDEIQVGGDLTESYCEVVDLAHHNFTSEKSIAIDLIVQSGTVTFGAVAFVTDETALIAE